MYWIIKVMTNIHYQSYLWVGAQFTTKKYLDDMEETFHSFTLSIFIQVWV